MANQSKQKKLQIHSPVHESVLSMTLAVYPGGQVQVKLPGVLLQVAIGLQPALFTAHSSMSAPSSSQVRKSIQ